MFTAEHYKMSIRRENEKHFYFSLVIFLAILLGIFYILSRHVYTVCDFFSDENGLTFKKYAFITLFSEHYSL